MYQTPCGDRILEGAERRLYEESLGVMVDFLADGDFEIGVTLFDQMQLGSKLVALYESGRALLRTEEPAPARAAYLEAAIAAVYHHVLMMVEMEIGDESLGVSPYHWRTLVADAAVASDDIEESPAIPSRSLLEWDLVIECLAEAVLWDRDFEIEEHLDADPESSNAIKTMLGIPPNYYSAIPLDPPDHQINLYFDALMGLTPCGRGEYMADEEQQPEEGTSDEPTDGL